MIIRQGKKGRRIHGLVAAAGKGSRFESTEPKQFTMLCGRPILVWTLERLLAYSLDQLTVALPADWLYRTHNKLLNDLRIKWITGGESRQESIYRCLLASSIEPDDVVLVHDGVRPFINREDLEATLKPVLTGLADGAVLLRPVVDTLKRVEGSEVKETVDRTNLFGAETPQVYRSLILASALEQALKEGWTGTDDSSVVERALGSKIQAVTARYPNPKLTYPGDLYLFEALMLMRENAVGSVT